jgi:hypothetical protein
MGVPSFEPGTPHKLVGAHAHAKTIEDHMLFIRWLIWLPHGELPSKPICFPILHNTSDKLSLSNS